MKPIYAIGDVHGELEGLDEALALVETDGGTSAKIVFLGDYTDRGKDSRGVIDRLIEGRDVGRDWTFLKGNHDRMFEWFLESPSRADQTLFIDLSWLHERLGGRKTLASYGLNFSNRRRLMHVHAEALVAVPHSHKEFLKACVLTYETEMLFFCHAGIRPGVALPAQTEEDLLWIREEFHTWSTPHPKLIIHGHSPVEFATYYGNRINLDTGAGYGKAVTAAVFEGGEVHCLTSNGRKAIKNNI